MYKNKLSFSLMEKKLSNFDIESKNNLNKIKTAKNMLHNIIEHELTNRQKQVLMMYFFDGYNISQIAKILNLNKSTVSRTLNIAIRNVEKYIKYYKFR